MALNNIWGIDIGLCSLKAINAVKTGARIEIKKFDMVEYDHILTEPGVDRDLEIQKALSTFLSRNDITKSKIFVSAAAQSALIRFIKLPPVDRKKIPDIVKYEAHQQIPFPLDEVIWDYQPIEKEYAPGEEVEVGIFALRREIVHSFISNLLKNEIDVEKLQLAPLAVYNFFAFESPLEKETSLVISIGAENTDLLIISNRGVWQRTLPIAGNDFTRAVQRAKNISFEKAEKIKRNLMQSPEAKTLYQTMAPVMRGLLSEIQRSIGFYKSLNPQSEIDNFYGLGNAFKLPGVERFLSKHLNVPSKSIKQLRNFDTTTAENQHVFQENFLTFATSLGLVAQAVGVGKIDINLLPREIIQRRELAKKKPFAFAAVATFIVMVAVLFGLESVKGGMYRNILSQKAPLEKTISEANERLSGYNKLNVKPVENKLNTMLQASLGRTHWLKIMQDFMSLLPDSRESIWFVDFALAQNESDINDYISQKGTGTSRTGTSFSGAGAMPGMSPMGPGASVGSAYPGMGPTGMTPGVSTTPTRRQRRIRNAIYVYADCETLLSPEVIRGNFQPQLENIPYIQNVELYDFVKKEYWVDKTTGRIVNRAVTGARGGVGTLGTMGMPGGYPSGSSGMVPSPSISGGTTPYGTSPIPGLQPDREEGREVETNEELKTFYVFKVRFTVDLEKLKPASTETNSE